MGCHPFHRVLTEGPATELAEQHGSLAGSSASRRSWLAAAVAGGAGAFAFLLGRDANAQYASGYYTYSYPSYPYSSYPSPRASWPPRHYDRPVTTQALGEEGSYSPPSRPNDYYTTRALGEEGGGYVPSRPVPPRGPYTTQALGEEGGYGGSPGWYRRPHRWEGGLPSDRVTTFALGEEGGGYYSR